MGLKDLKEDLDEEVSTLLGADFSIDVTKTSYVPSSDDPSITFPNFDTSTQGAKLIDSCVLYIDIRRSTSLNLTHRPKTVAKLYSAFIRAMTRVARYHGGHVRGIIGDRLMVIFDVEGAFINAVECAISMSSVSQYIINKHFKHNEVSCGIGIDAGKMLVTKTGIRRHGSEQANYKNLVWLGRPANIASKLTDLANKPAQSISELAVMVATSAPQNAGLFGLGGLMSNANALAIGALGALGNWRWEKQTARQFLEKLKVQFVPTRMVHSDPTFESFYLTEDTRQIAPSTPAILMTKAVWDGYRAAAPGSDLVRKLLVKRVAIKVPDFTDAVFGCNAIYPALRD